MSMTVFSYWLQSIELWKASSVRVNTLWRCFVIWSIQGIICTGDGDDK